MAKEDLIPFNQRSEAEVKEMNRRGGINSGKARLRKKHGRELMLALLQLKEPDPRVIAKLEELGVDAKDVTKEVAMQLRQIEQAIAKGDTQAFNAVNKLAGHLDDEGTTNAAFIVNITKDTADALGKWASKK